jgi:hypothetical protein
MDGRGVFRTAWRGFQIGPINRVKANACSGKRTVKANTKEETSGENLDPRDRIAVELTSAANKETVSEYLRTAVAFMIVGVLLLLILPERWG